MLERFTQKAIKVIMLAQEEARRRGQALIGEEHILLGLMSEGTSIAAQLLFRAGANLQEARRLVKSDIGQGFGNVPVEIPFTLTARQTLHNLLASSRQQGPNFSVATEHLLWGILQNKEGEAVRLLANLGLDLQNLTERLNQAISGAYESVVDFEEKLSDRRGNLTCDTIAIRLAASLQTWVEPRQMGCIATKSVRLKHISGIVLSPDVSFISQARLQQQAERTDAQLVPELVAVISSSVNWPREFHTDLYLFSLIGVQVGLLIDLASRQVVLKRRPNPEGRRPDQQPTRTNLLTQDWFLGDGETLSVPELLPGWKLPVSELWAAKA